MTSTPTLTQRYLAEATRHAPPSRRDELRNELAERIGDGIDARVQDGAPPSTAEYSVLSEMGRPDALVADYLDQSQYLIGPALYPMWRRLVRVLFATVLPVAVIGVVLGQLLAQRTVGQVAAATAMAILSVTVHLGFWSTLVFAILQRYAPHTAVMTWTPESLPAVTDQPRHQLRSDVIANLVFTALLATGIVLYPVLIPATSVSGAGDPAPLFQTGTWAWLVWYLLVVLALDVVFWVGLYRRGRWDLRSVALRLVLSAAFTVPLAWVVATGRLFDGSFFVAAGWPDGVTQTAAGGTTTVLLTFVLVAVTFVSTIDGFLKAKRPAHRQ